jgi:hypothetical protein
MRAELAAIELGSRVVYVVIGVEYNALALGTASEGSALGSGRLSSIFLSVTYLNALGGQVKVIAAPLLGVAADDEHLAEVAQQAAERTFGYATADREKKAQMFAEQLANIKASPRTNGWRPYVEGEELATLRAQLAQANEAIGQLHDARVEFMKPVDPVTELLDLLAMPVVAAYVTARENAELIEGIVLKAKGETQPSAEDLDHLAAFAADLIAGSLGDATGDSTEPAPVMPTDPTDSESVLAAQAAGAAQLDPSSASSSTQAVDASSSQDEDAGTPQGGEAEDTSTSASTEAPAVNDNPGSAGDEPAEQSQTAAPGE